MNRTFSPGFMASCLTTPTPLPTNDTNGRYQHRVGYEQTRSYNGKSGTTHSLQRADRLIEHTQQEVGVVLRDAHWRSETDRLPPESAFTEQETELARVLDRLRAFFLSGLFGRAVFHELDA